MVGFLIVTGIKMKPERFSFPTALTIRGILDQIDRLNLRGAVFTGLDEGWEGWQEEGNRYFRATPRIMVMKKGSLA